MYGVAFWLPQIIGSLSGLNDVSVAFLSAIPYLFAAVCMVPVARHSDATGERRWHVAVPCAVGAVAMFGTAIVDAPIPGLILLSCTAIADLGGPRSLLGAAHERAEWSSRRGRSGAHQFDRKRGRVCRTVARWLCQRRHQQLLRRVVRGRRLVARSCNRGSGDST